MLFLAARMTLDHQKLGSRSINFICDYINVYSMPKERKQNNVANEKEPSLEELLEQLPPPPPEHVHELKMEKRVKQLLKEQKKKQ